MTRPGPERPWIARIAVFLALAAILVAAPRRAFASAAPGGLPGQEAAAPPAGSAHAAAPEPRADGPLPPPVELSPAQEARARALEGELRCPVCRSQSIRQSRSFMAEDMRRRLHTLIVEGRTDEEIRRHFVERYGTWVLLTPPKSGFNLAAYLLPALVVGLGAGALVVVARRWSRDKPRAEHPSPPPKRYLERLERELEETER